MTVEELIELLQSYPTEDKVTILQSNHNSPDKRDSLTYHQIKHRGNHVEIETTVVTPKRLY